MKPNVVIVMTDQQRADLRRGCGYALDTMPFLDSFAAQGTDFRRAYTPNPCCVPARVSMFTGRYPSCHHVRTNHNLADATYTEDLLDVMRRCGYRTALCGKNHSHRRADAFDYARTNGHLSGGGETNETPEQQPLAAFLTATQHMEMHEPSPGGVEAQHPYRNVSDALSFIDGCGDAPFFLWLSFAEPHNPYQVPRPYYDMFPPEALPPLESAGADIHALGPMYAWERGMWERVLGTEIEERILRARSNYHGMLRLIDDQFRRFMEGLSARGLRENTVVVFLSDHGDYVGEYGLLRKGVELPEVLTRVTMAWQGPGVRAGVLDDTHCVSLVDDLPTLCGMLNTETPFGVQGRDLGALLRGEAPPAGEFDVGYAENGYGGLYWQPQDALRYADDRCFTDGKTFQCMSSWTLSGQMRMARKGDYKIQTDMMGNVKLFCLRDDPAELHNLWPDAAPERVKTDMLLALNTAMLRADDPLPAPHNRYRTKVHPRGYWQDSAYLAQDPGVRMTPYGDYACHNEHKKEK